ncbi:DUF4149 domain-containing protein [Geomonas sp. RF6]|uniref:DUF4149 domain-containing protein n=1 Tax=Geomonas sp. RF6 TaxID=2897342 RepID=UPI001E4BAFE8|nr:DUF4149 domain-containing protein [Geomonas sp. RF6]UFS72725.1 DUF4149 domain-containing protein [Geomonas sp. RF6]
MRILIVLYRLAVSLWFGGAALFTFVLTPTLFRNEMRDVAGRIVGLLFPGYFRWGLACGVVALIARAIVRGYFLTTSSAIIVVMLILCSVQAFVIEPRAAELKRKIGSFEQTSKDDPLRQEFSKLHGVSAGCNLLVIVGGATLVALF